jgi:hypothetical protein
MLKWHRPIDAGYTALGYQYRRLKLRRGSKRAAVAVAHSLLVIAYPILKDKTIYCERVSNLLDPQDRAVRMTRRARQFILVKHRSLHKSVSQRHQLQKTTCLSQQNPLCWKVGGHLTWHPQKKT